VLVNAGERSERGKIATAPRIAMIDMDAQFCVRTGRTDASPTAPTTIEDLERRLGGVSDGPDGDHLDAACISLLIHCVFSARGNGAATRAYGFPYAQIAVCLCRNWDAVWDLLIDASRDREGDESDEFDAADLVATYFHPKQDDRRFIRDADKALVKAALDQAVRFPMTRLMLATRGLDVDSSIEPIGLVETAMRVAGDLYERVATLVVPDWDRESFEGDLAAALARDRLEKFVEECESGAYPRQPWGPPLVCRKNKNGMPCKHGAQAWSGASGVMTPMRVHYSDAAYPAYDDALSGGMKGATLDKVVRACDSREAARLVCHLLRRQTHTDTRVPYTSAVRVVEKGWTGKTLVRMHRERTMKTRMMGIGIPDRNAADLAATIGSYIKTKLKIQTLDPCRVT
jgi:hypothetical protein